MPNLNLNAASGSSLIHVPGYLSDIGSIIENEKTILLVDENVLKYHGEKLEAYKLISIPSGENSKSIDSYSRVFSKMMEYGVDRSWNLLGIGGGITTDLSGFIASTFYRGIPFSYISTTLLGQVDAAIGGKTGINFQGYKNLVGVIRQPQKVYCELNALKTLEKEEFIGGFSEIIKYGFIKNPSISDFLDSNIEAALNFDLSVLEHIVYQSVKVKKEVVEKDETEQGDRKLLNFGHTFAHAIEKLYGLSHGKAVAIGMVLAARMSVNFGLLKDEVRSKLEKLIAKTGLPIYIDFDPEQMAKAMLLDKKKAGDMMKFILLKEEGHAIVKEVKLLELNSILNDLR